MQKKVLAILLCGLLGLSLFACGAKGNDGATSGVVAYTESIETENKSNETVTEAENSDESKNETDMTSEISGEAKKDTSSENEGSDELYSDEKDLEEYSNAFIAYRGILQDMFNVLYYCAMPVNNRLEVFGGIATYMTDDEKAKVGYTYYDIDANGTLELIVGDSNKIYAVASHDKEGSARVLIAGGERSTVCVYENGFINSFGSAGAASDLVTFYSYKNGDLITNDFYFTDFDPEDDTKIAYYHSKDGNWDTSEEYRISEAEYNVGTEVGLEELSFADKYLPLYEDGYMSLAGKAEITLESLKGTAWDIEYITENEDVFYDVDPEMVTDIFTFCEDGLITYQHSDGGHDFFTNEIDGEDSEYNHSVYLNFVNYDGEFADISIVGITAEGKLIVQQGYYDNVEGMGVYKVRNMYYTPSCG